MEEIKRLDDIVALMFPGKYRSIGYEFSTDNRGKVFAWFTCYVEGYRYGRGSKPEQAVIDMLKDGGMTDV